MWEPTKLTPAQFVRFQRFIHRETGIHMQEGKVTLLSNRIRRRLKQHGIESFEDYYELLTTRRLPGELEHFIDAVTTNETYFFRTESHFEWLGGPGIDAGRGNPRRRSHQAASGPVATTVGGLSCRLPL